MHISEGQGILRLDTSASSVYCNYLVRRLMYKHTPVGGSMSKAKTILNSIIMLVNATAFARAPDAFVFIDSANGQPRPLTFSSKLRM